VRRLCLYAALLSFGAPGLALELSFSGPATLTYSQTEDFASYKLPVGPYQDGATPALVAEGPREQFAWKVESASGTTLGVADNLRRQLEAVGFELLYECETDACGGFDFRFQTEVLPEPVMHIDLGDYRYLSAQRLGGPVPEYVSLFVSRSDTLGYVQLIRVGGQGFEPTQTITAPTAQAAPSQPRMPLIDRLETRGSAILQDLEFATGSSELTGQDYATLTTLANYLKAQPNRKIALVGHTDAEGSLQGNIALSRQRARAAMQRLIELGVPRAQLEAEGVGYLAPMANNLTEEGRTQNRRVEAILTSTQ